MCGIFAYLGNTIGSDKLEKECMKTRNRGPDDNILKMIHKNVTFGFHRLAIMDTSFKGNQPLFHPKKPYAIICNGEIYNHKKLIEENDFETYSNSDCEVILYLYEKYGLEETLKMLDSEAFAFCIYDGLKEELIVVRDRFGVRPLFMGVRINKEIIFASEAKSIINLLIDTDIMEQFPPGTWKSYDINTFEEKESTRYYEPKYAISTDSDEKTICSNIRELLTKAVKKRLMSERKIGCLLSGGLDSSLISAIVAREFVLSGKGTLDTFSIGMKGSTDLEYAKLVAEHIGSNHHTIELTEQEFLDAIPEVIYHIESYDTTTIRASVGNYLVGRYIKENTDITVVFNGDGSDEQSGYLYMANAPDSFAFKKECERLLGEIQFYDVMRSDRALSSNWSLETRAPFLDTEFVDYYMSIYPELKMYPKNSGRIEKYLLRKAFDNERLLPSKVLWRRKEAFSDGCSSNERSWHNIIKEHVDNEVSDNKFERLSPTYKHNEPQLKETYYYRTIFEKYYPNRGDLIPHYWLPKWNGDQKDPSARELEEYNTGA
jgi:asparagine synthase (glutamine-hydrolysing)